jgi:hypothetical protein
MGVEHSTTVWIGDETAHCKVFLESKELIIRGDLKRKCIIEKISQLKVNQGKLTFTHDGETVAIDLGSGAEKWLERIQNPRTRVQKLGVKPGMKIALLGEFEADVPAEIEQAAETVSLRKLDANLDMVLLFVEETKALSQLKQIPKSLAKSGCIWVLFPKGRKDIRHEDVVDHAKKAGLSESKSMAFSEKFSGLRLTVSKLKKAK